MAARKAKRAYYASLNTSLHTKIAANIVYTVTGGETGTDKTRHLLSDHQDLVLTIDASGTEPAIEIILEARATGKRIACLARFEVTTGRVQDTMHRVAGAWQMACTMADTEAAWLME